MNKLLIILLVFLMLLISPYSSKAEEMASDTGASELSSIYEYEELLEILMGSSPMSWWDWFNIARVLEMIAILGLVCGWILLATFTGGIGVALIALLGLKCGTIGVLWGAQCLF